MIAWLKPRLKIIVPAAFFLLIVALALMVGLREFVRLYIVVPVSYAAWFIDLVLRSISQSTYWAILVVIGALLAWQSVGSLRSLIRKRTVVALVPDKVGQSRLVERRDLFSRVDDSAFARERIAFEMRSLIVQLLAYQERQSVAEIELRIRNHAISAPPDVKSLLVDWRSWLTDEPTRTPPSTPRQAGRGQEASSRSRMDIGGLFHRLRLPWRAIQRVIRPSPFEPRLVKAITYMESISGGLYAVSAPQEEPNGRNIAN